MSVTLLKSKSLRRIWLTTSLVIIITFFLLNNSQSIQAKEEEEGEEDEVGSAVEPHPDPNEEDYPNMIYVGRIQDGRRLSNDYDNAIKYIFGTAFDDRHKDIEEKDLLHHDDDNFHDIPDSTSSHLLHKTREEVLKERRHNNVSNAGPVPFGHVDTNELDGGVTPVKAVTVEPFFLDATAVTNKEFAKFVKSTYYETEAEKYGWSYVLSSFVPRSELTENDDDWEVDPDAQHWVAVKGAYWRQPEGPSSSYKYREHHPVVHVSHRDAAEYCAWVGKRLPGEREWEAAARAKQWNVSTPAMQKEQRTIYLWGDDDEWTSEQPRKHANLWGAGEFPHENLAEDGWRGTSPVRNYPPNDAGFYDMTGNVWEWMRGGKLKARIVRGASYVDSLQGDFNHAATLGARSVIHGTTTTGNVGFRCAKTPKKRVEHHWTWHDEEIHGQLGIEDKFGRKHMVPEKGWEDHFDPDNFSDEEEVDEDEDVPKRRKRKVVKKYERLSTEL